MEGFKELRVKARYIASRFFFVSTAVYISGPATLPGLPRSCSPFFPREVSSLPAELLWASNFGLVAVMSWVCWVAWRIRCLTFFSPVTYPRGPFWRLSKEGGWGSALEGIKSLDEKLSDPTFEDFLVPYIPVNVSFIVHSVTHTRTLVDIGYIQTLGDIPPVIYTILKCSCKTSAWGNKC